VAMIVDETEKQRPAGEVDRLGRLTPMRRHLGPGADVAKVASFIRWPPFQKSSRRP
jgi:hypothetical protein